MRRFLIAAALAALPLPVLADNGVPESRVVMSRDTDFPGGDLGQYFDTTLDACEATCLADNACIAFTFNARSASCFPKGSLGDPAPFANALSGMVIATDPAVLAAAPARAADLGFLRDGALDRAERITREVGRRSNVMEGVQVSEIRAIADGRSGSPRTAARLSIVALEDRPEDWLAYGGTIGQALDWRDGLLSALVAAYLRADDAELRTEILIAMAGALEDINQGRGAIGALRLSQSIQHRRDVEPMLNRLVGLYGFRVASSEVDSEPAEPRICVVFNEDLAQAGVDYAPYVQLPDAAFTVEVEGAQLCIDGVAHGQRYRIMLRPGLPAASGETLLSGHELNLYVRDRQPSARFVSRAYVLPRTQEAGLPVETVNADRLDLTLFRVSDRNLLQSMRDGQFGQPLYSWDVDWFEEGTGEKVWSGQAVVGQELNRDVMTRIPLAEPLRDQPAGLYVLNATIPGVDPDDMPGATQWFVLSDLGISTYEGVDGLTVDIRSLATTAPVAGAKVTLVNRVNAVLGEAESDAAGTAVFAAGLTRGTGAAQPAMVVVETADDMAFLSLQDPALDLSDRGVEGREPAGPMDVFLTADRGVYRAGETVHLTALMRDENVRALNGVPLTVIVTRPDGVEYARVASPQGLGGGHVYALPIAPNAPRGQYGVEVRADVNAPALARTEVLVEDFLPERIDVTLNAPETAALGATIPVEVAANWLFGPPAAEMTIAGQVYLAATNGLPGWPDYRFGRADDEFSTLVELFSGLATDAEGKALIDAPQPYVEGLAPRPLQASVVVQVTEGSGRPVERRATLDIAPWGPMIGIRSLNGDAVPVGGRAEFLVAAVAPERGAEPIAAEWVVNRVITRYQWYSRWGRWNWDPVVRRERVAAGQIALGYYAPEDGALAEGQRIAAAVDWGHYELVVTAADGAEAQYDFYAGWYGAGTGEDTPDRLQVALDAESYSPGDTAVLLTTAETDGLALVSVMTDRVIERRAVEMTAGENRIPLTVTEDWGAGAYVAVSLIRPMDEAAGRNPARAMGIVHAAVAPGDRQLSVVLETPLQAQPRERLTLAVDVQGAVPGEPAWVTVAAVDVGILNLTGFDSPDPSGYYFGQRKLGVEMRDVYGRLIDGMTGALGEIRSGGDAMLNLAMQSPPPTEELVSYFTGPVEVDANGRAEVGFDLPAFNGTLRVMAVAWSDRGVGQAEAEVLVRDPVVVTASVPRFLAPGDQSRLLLEITHAEGPAGEMGLSVTSDGLDLATQLIPAAFTLAPEGMARFSLPITAGEPGIHSITVTVTTPAGRELTRTLTVPVQVNDPEVSQTLRLSLAPGQVFTFDNAVFDGMRAGTGEATLSVGPLARFDAAGLLAMLDRYPYGCTEQVTSAAMPLLYFNDVAAAMGLGDQAEIEKRIADAITAVLANQGANGGFGLWGPWSNDLWLDSYVTDFLSRARARGHAVPDVAWGLAIDNLKNRVNTYPDFENDGTDLAYALMVLAREGQAAVGDLRYFADERGGNFATPLAAAQLGAALAFYGDQPRADMMFAIAQNRIRGLQPELPQSIWRADYGTDRRDIAAVLALAVEAGSQVIDADSYAGRLAGTGGQLSTQEAAWTLMAANALIDDLRETGLTIDGQKPGGPIVRVRADDAAVAPVRIANDGVAATDVTVTTFGVPEIPPPAGGQGYRIDRAWYTLTGEPVDPAAIRVGDRLVAVVTVAPLGRQDGRLIIADPLPAGLEIDNPNLVRAGDLSALSWLSPATPNTAEFRQDRFVAALDLRGEGAQTLAYVLRAVSPGEFHHPAASVEDMYRPQMRANTDAGRVVIAE